MSTIYIKGLKQLIDKVEAASKDKVDDALKRAGKQSAQLLETRMKQNAPKDTGNLRNSITTTELGELMWQVGPDINDAPYALWVEVGHHTKSGSWVPGQKYIANTRIELERTIINLFIKAVKDITK